VANKFTNVTTYVFILFFIGLFLLGVKSLASETISNTNANLDNDSTDYIAGLISGIDAEALAKTYNLTTEEVNKAILVKENFSQGNPKDYALDFIFAKEKAFPLENEIKQIYSFPSFLITKVLRLPVLGWQWIIDAISWFLFFAIGIAVINYVRKGAPDQ